MTKAIKNLSKVHSFKKFAIILAFHAPIFHAHAASLSMTFLKKGNATSLEEKTEEVDSLFISQQGSLLVRHDQQFMLTPSYEMVTSDEGKTTIEPYNGSENTSFESDTMNYDWNDLRYGAVNTAYWLNKTVDKVQRLGFLNTKKMSLRVFTHCQDMLNAYFSPTNNLLCIGHLHKTLGRNSLGGMASLAWDGDVVVHELGHAILHHVSTMTEKKYFSFSNDQLGAMNEGQADFFSYAVLGNTKMAPWMMTIMREYYRVKKPQVFKQMKHRKALREIDNMYKLSEHSFGEIHNDGRIFAGALYDLADALGTDNALSLWLQAVTKITEASTFYDHAQLVLEADKEMFQGKNQNKIYKVFKSRGFFENEFNIEDLEVTAQVIDDPVIVGKILASLGVSQQASDDMTKNLNKNGTVEEGECVSIELQFTNKSKKSLVGVEIFAPNHKFPKGLSNKGQNRNYIGVIPSGQSYPTSIDLSEKGRPWLFVCADKEYDSSQPLPIYIRHSGPEIYEMKLAFAN